MPHEDAPSPSPQEPKWGTRGLSAIAIVGSVLGLFLALIKESLGTIIIGFCIVIIVVSLANIADRAFKPPPIAAVALIIAITVLSIGPTGGAIAAWRFLQDLPGTGESPRRSLPPTNTQPPETATLPPETTSPPPPATTESTVPPATTESTVSAQESDPEFEFDPFAPGEPEFDPGPFIPEPNPEPPPEPEPEFEFDPFAPE